MRVAEVDSVEPPLHSNADFRNLGDVVVPNGHGQLIYQSTSVGSFYSENRWVFSLPKGSVAIRMSTQKDHADAKNVMQDHLSTFDVPLDEIFVKPSKGTGKGQFNLECKDKDILSIWVRGNLFFDVKMLTPGADLAALTGAIDDFVKRTAVDPLKGAYLVPKISGLVASTVSPVVGEKFIVTATVNAEIGGMTATSSAGVSITTTQLLSFATTDHRIFSLEFLASIFRCGF